MLLQINLNFALTDLVIEFRDGDHQLKKSKANAFILKKDRDLSYATVSRSFLSIKKVHFDYKINIKI